MSSHQDPILISDSSDNDDTGNWNTWQEVEGVNTNDNSRVKMPGVCTKLLFDAMRRPETCNEEDRTIVMEVMSRALGRTQTEIETKGPLTLDQIQQLLDKTASVQLTKVEQVWNKYLGAEYKTVKEVYGGLELLTYHGTLPENVDRIIKDGFRVLHARRAAIGNGPYAATVFWIALVYADAYLQTTLNHITFKILVLNTWADKDPVFGWPRMGTNFGVHPNGTPVISATNMLSNGLPSHTNHAHRTIVCSKLEKAQEVKYVLTLTCDLNKVAPWCSDRSFFAKSMAEMKRSLIGFRWKLDLKQKHLFRLYSGGFPGNLLSKMQDSFVTSYRQHMQNQEFSAEWKTLLETVFKQPFSREIPPPAHYDRYQVLAGTPTFATTSDYPGFPNYRGPPSLPQEAAADEGSSSSTAGGAGGGAGGAGGAGGGAGGAAGGAGNAAGGAGNAAGGAGNAAGGAGNAAGGAGSASQQVQGLNFRSPGIYWQHEPGSKRSRK